MDIFQINHLIHARNAQNEITLSFQRMKTLETGLMENYDTNEFGSLCKVCKINFQRMDYSKH